MEKVIYHIGITFGSEHCRDFAPYYVTRFNLELVNRILGWMAKFEEGGPLEGADEVVFFNEDATRFVSSLGMNEWHPDEESYYSEGMFSTTYSDEDVVEAEGAADVELHISGERFYYQTEIEYTDEVAENKVLHKTDLLNLLAQLEGT